MRALYIRWHRLQNAAIFVAGGIFFSAILAFAAGNDTQIEIHWLAWNRRLPLWEVAMFPLAAGLVLGYVYQLPARLHSMGEWFHHRQRVQELEHELRELRQSLDHVLQMPETDRPAKLAKIEHKALPQATESGGVDPFAAGGERERKLDEHDEHGARTKDQDGHDAKAGKPQAVPADAKKPAPARSRRGLLRPLRDELKTIKVPETKVVASAHKPANGRRPRTRKAVVAAPAEPN